MNEELLCEISGGNPDFLKDHSHFEEDISRAVELLEKMLE
jgi:hypothetical protein